MLAEEVAVTCARRHQVSVMLPARLIKLLPGLVKLLKVNWVVKLPKPLEVADWSVGNRLYVVDGRLSDITAQ